MRDQEPKGCSHWSGNQGIYKTGEKKSKAGFAKVLVGQETKENAQSFVDQRVTEGSTLRTDGAKV